MYKKKIATAFVICLFLLVAFEVVYIFSELYTESDIPQEVIPADSLKFKEEYELFNKDDHYRKLTIEEKNPFVYKRADEITKMIDDKESFIVYFGFATCPWCRSVIPSMIEAAKAAKIKEIYYVDVETIRDYYELDSKHKPIKTVDGTEAYDKLLEQLDNVLEDYGYLSYTNKKKKEVNVKVESKRIFAPNVVVIRNGEAIALESGISKLQTDPMQDLTEEITKETVSTFTNLFKKLNTDTCSLDDNKC